ncbi:hypothetical protein YC2023_076738 [Brassica napus]
MDQASVSSNLRGTHGKIKVKAIVLECFMKQQMYHGACCGLGDQEEKLNQEGLVELCSF